MLPIAELYFKLGESEKGKKIMAIMAEAYTQEADYYMSMKKDQYGSLKNNSQQSVSILYRVNLMTKQYLPEAELTAQIEEDFKRLEAVFSGKPQ
jgi:hypothetical protein